MGKSPIKVEVIAVLPGAVSLEGDECSALMGMAPRLGGTSVAAASGFEREASLLLKLLLARQCHRVEVQRAPNGKPFIPQQPFHWNLSHDPALVCAAVAPISVGVDVEPIVVPTEVSMAALRRATSKKWGEWVEEAPTTEGRALRFARAWTAAEAMLKARGEGFAREGRGASLDFGGFHCASLVVADCMVTCATSEPLRLAIHQASRETFAPCWAALGEEPVVS